MSYFVLPVYLALFTSGLVLACAGGVQPTQTTEPHRQCAYTFYVPRGSSGHCEGQEVDEALSELRGTTDTLDDQVTALIGQNTALQNQVAALMQDNGQLRQRMQTLEEGRPKPCNPGEPGCGTAAHPRGAVSSVYIRWGRTTCPHNATNIYVGYAAGAHYTHGGGPSNYLCLPQIPQWDQFQEGHQGASYVYGAEIEVNTPFDPFDKTNARQPSVHDQSPPCVLCHVTGSVITRSFPAMTQCPAGWRLEYAGYMMTAHHSHSGRTDAVCMDGAPEVVKGGNGDQNGVLFYFMEIVCGALPCPSYVEGRELACVVCSI